MAMLQWIEVIKMDSRNTKESWDREMSIAQIFGQMFSGSLVAGALVGVPVVFIVVLMWLGEFLPEESKLADDPTPDSFISSSE
tara:strand:- start:693 stop:941 length:249 start_codon:yes stop_codon:yes gene_type:complete